MNERNVAFLTDFKLFFYGLQNPLIQIEQEKNIMLPVHFQNHPEYYQSFTIFEI